MPDLLNKETGEVIHVPGTHVEKALASGVYAPIEGETVSLRKDLAVDVGELAKTSLGAETSQQRGKRERGQFLEDKYGGTSGMIRTGAEGILRGATAGISDAVARGLGADVEDMRFRQEVNQPIATVAEIGGAVVPGLLSGGAGAAGTVARLTPAGRAAAIGEGIAARGGFGRRAAGFATEGAIQGAGQGLSSVALSDDEMTAERVIGAMSSGALMGGAVGAGAGVAASVAEKGLRKAKKLLDDVGAKAKEAPGAIPDDLATLDKAGLRDARATEQVAGGERVATDFASYRKVVDEVDPLLVSEGGQSKVLLRSKKSATGALDNPKGIVSRPSQLRDSLQREEKIFGELIEGREAKLAKLAAEDVALAKDLDGILSGKSADRRRLVYEGDAATAPGPMLQGKLARRYGEMTGKKISATAAKEGIEVAADEVVALREALSSGRLQGARAKSLGRIEEVLEHNRTLQKGIDDILNGSTPRLKEIAAAEDLLSAPAAPKGMLERAAEGTIFSAVTAAIAPVSGMLAPMVGAKVAGKVTDLVFGRLGKAAGAAGKRSADAVSRLLDVGAKATRSAPVLATRTLTSTAFGPEPSKVARAMSAPSKAVRAVPVLLNAYRARESELRSQTTPGPDGAPVMRPAARRQMAQQLSAVKALSPMLADRLETIQARRIEFLASKLPRQPGYSALRAGPDTWQPSDMAMRAFARYAAAVEDPAGVEERLADGTLTPEDAEAYKAVYPERYADMKRQIIERLPELREKLPYARRLSLSIFMGVPVDPAMDPPILRVLQGQFAAEPGTGGGMSAPVAQPQFGSISKPEGTPSQERQQRE